MLEIFLFIWNFLNIYHSSLPSIHRITESLFITGSPSNSHPSVHISRPQIKNSNEPPLLKFKFFLNHWSSAYYYQTKTMPLPLQAPQPLPAVISYFTDVLCNSSRRLLVRPLRQSSLTRTFDLEILLRQVDYDKKKNLLWRAPAWVSRHFGWLGMEVSYSFC
jgi:hypothetical protein